MQEQTTEKERKFSMATNLSERIRQKMSNLERSSKNINKAKFLALKPEIENALTDGWSIKTIWNLLFEEKKINFSYQSFRCYVNKLILLPKKSVSLNSETHQPLPIEKPAISPDKIKMEGFKFDSTPKKEELF